MKNSVSSRRDALSHFYVFWKIFVRIKSGFFFLEYVKHVYPGDSPGVDQKWENRSFNLKKACSLSKYAYLLSVFAFDFLNVLISGDP